MPSKVSERGALLADFARRGRLAAGPPIGPSVSKWLLSEIRRRDKDFELVWGQRAKRWALYRVIRRAACPSDDVLVKCLDLDGVNYPREHGPWILDVLDRKSTRHYGGGSPERDAVLQTRRIEEHNEKIWQSYDKEWDDANTDAAKNMYRYFRKGRTGKRQGDPLKKKTPKGKKLIYGPDGQEIRH